MFENLQDGFHAAFKSLRGKGKLTEANMREGLSLVEQSLLGADVSYSVVTDFMAHVTEQALGEKVLLSLDPSQQLVKIVHDELINILGPVDPSLHLRGDVTTIMLCGLQGSGKTTTCGKMAQLIQKEGKQAMLCAADLQRPAAVEQLQVIGEQVGAPVYSETGATDPIQVCRNAVQAARDQGVNVLILDTAGRLAIDEELMDQLKRIDQRVGPDQAYLVVDGMTGQDAVNSAGAFNEALELDGVIMTKLDGDARGGALLSVKHVTEVPIKFIGTGETMDGLEPFYPERMAGRILGMGDMLSMVETAQREFDETEMKATEERLRKGEFTLEDFRKQLQQIAKPGLMKKMMGMMPGMGELNKMMGDVDAENDMRRLFGIIDSMTPVERRNPKVIDPSRRQRIATGSGVQPQEVNELIKQFDGMKSIMESMAGKGMRERMQMVRELQSGGMLDPGGKLAKQKKGTGKRIRPNVGAKEIKRRQKDKKRNQKKNKRRKR
jgi:signal recognition particle subunit SRP54